MSLEQALKHNGLSILGACDIEPSDNLAQDFKQILLIAPDEPKFWDIFQNSTEYKDNLDNPLDRWSKRVINPIAENLDAHPLYPYDGPPWHPFIQWALRSQSCFVSPSGLLVHGSRGLFVSFRAAIAIKKPLEISTLANPCQTCANKPCIKTCPVDALTQDNYDVPECVAHIKSDEHSPCREGCLVRRACPIGAGLRPPAQSRFHMNAFLKNK